MGLTGWSEDYKRRLTFDSALVDTDLTDFVAPVLIDATSGKTDFDMSDVFDLLTPLDVDDDFTGTDGADPDVRLWEDVQYASTDTTGNVVPDIRNNSLDFAISVTESFPYISSRYVLSGDFDIQVDYAIDAIPSPDESWSVGLLTQTDNANVFNFGSNYASSARYSVGSGPYRANTEGGTADTGGNSDTSGKFRITRSGSTCNLYYWGGSSWALLHTDTSYTTADVYILLHARVWDGNKTLNANFDNFTINSGTVKWLETPKKIAFEIGDTGVQCYGEIVNWDYNNLQAHLDIKVPSVLAAENSVLHFYADPGRADNDFITAAEASDDFTGTDGDAPRSDLWSDKEVGTPFSIQSNKLNLSTVVTSSTSIILNCKISGDFDTQFDCDLISAGGTGWLARLFVTADISGDGWNDDWTYVDLRNYGTKVYRGSTKIGGGTSTSTESGTSDTSTKLRLARVGTVLTCYAWTGSSWSNIHSVSGFTTDDVYVVLSTFINNDAVFEVDIDNFLINSADSITGFIGDTNSHPSDIVHSARAFVSHQAQDPTGSILDSSPSAKHGTSYGSMTSGDLIDGLTGKAIDYDGDDDFTNHGYDAAHDITDELTIAVVITPSVTLDDGLSDNVGIVSRQFDPTDIDDSYALFINDVGTLQLGSSGGNIRSTKASWAADTTFVIHATYNATGLVGELFVDGVKEVLTNDALDTMAGSTNNLVIGKNDDAGEFFPGWIDEVIIINGIMSDAWIKAHNAALRDNLITFSDISVNLISFIDMSYGDLIAYHQVAVDQLYSILFPLSTFIDQYYSIKLGISLLMYYGDSPELKNIINQYYSDAPKLLKKTDMEYGDMLMLRQYSDMPYIIPFDLKRILEMKYSLTGEPLISVLNQQYSLLLNEILRKKLDQIYMLQEGNKLSQVSTSVIIGGNFVNPHHVNVEYSIDSSVASGEVHLASEEEYIKIHQGDDVEITINGETHIFIVDTEPKRSRTKAGATNYVIECVSPAIKLTSPWSNVLTCSFDADTAMNIFEALAYPIIVDWKIVNFPILKDTLYANNEDRYSVMRKITQSAGATMQSNPDGSIRVMYRYPTAVKDWKNAIPEYFLTDSLNFISQDETFKHNGGINKYIVSNASTPEDRIWMEQDDYPDVIAFEVPWKGTEMSLEHSGGSGVKTPEYMGIIELMYPPEDEDAEQLEFVAGFSTTSRPIYTENLNGEQIPIQITWIRKQLGSLTISEDGRVEAEYKTGDTDGYSLATIRYLTRYNLWKVNNGTEQNVQYILRIDGEYGTNNSCF